MLKLTDYNIGKYFVAATFAIFITFISSPKISAQEVKKTQNLKESITRSEDQILITSLVVGDDEISDGVIIYKDADKILIPLSTIFKYLEIPINVNTASGIANGWFINEKHIFNLDLNSETVSFNDKIFTLNKDIVEVNNGEIYVEKNALENWLPIKIELNTLNLSLTVTSSEPLPIQIRKIKAQRREKLLKDKNDPLKNVITDNTKFSIPTVDITAGYIHADQKGGQSSNNYNYSLYGQNIFAGLDTDWSISDSSIKKFQPYTNLKFSKYYVNEKDQPNKLVKKFEFGDTFSIQNPLVSGVKSGRGIKLSSFDENVTQNNNSVIIEGPLLNGWEVELYQDSTLLDFKSQPDQGRYRFTVNTANIGANIFRLVFYGPQGQIREENKTIYVKEALVKAGEFGMESSLMQENRKLINSQKQDYTNSNSVTSFNSLAKYGITNNLASSFGISLSKLTNRADTANEYQLEPDNFATFGLNTSILNMALQYNNAISIKNGGMAHNFELETKFLNTNLKGKYDLYGDTKTDKSLFYGKYVKNHLSINLNRTFDAYFLGNIPAYFSYDKAKAIDDNSKDLEQYSWSISKNIRSAYVTLKNDYLSDYEQTQTSNFSLQSNIPIKKLMFRNTINYKKIPNTGLDSVVNSLEYRPGSLYYGFDWNRNYIYNEGAKTKHTNNYQFHIAKTTKKGIFGLDYSTDNKKYKSISLNYSVGLGYDKENKEFKTNSDGYKNTGSISVFVFLDRNRNGIFDKNEPALENVKFKNFDPNMKTNKKGHIFIAGLEPYVANALEVNETDEDEIPFNIAFPKKKIYYMVKPGSNLTLYLPAIEVGDVDGNLLGMESKPIKNIEVLLKDLQGNIVSKTTSENDGYFLFHAIPIGKYTISFNQDQLKKLGYTNFRERIIELRANTAALTLTNINLDQFLKTEKKLFLKNSDKKNQKDQKLKKFNIKSLDTTQSRVGTNKIQLEKAILEKSENDKTKKDTEEKNNDKILNKEAKKDEIKQNEEEKSSTKNEKKPDEKSKEEEVKEDVESEKNLEEINQNKIQNEEKNKEVNLNENKTEITENMEKTKMVKIDKNETKSTNSILELNKNEEELENLEEDENKEIDENKNSLKQSLEKMANEINEQSNNQLNNISQSIKNIDPINKKIFNIKNIQSTKE